MLKDSHKLLAIATLVALPISTRALAQEQTAMSSRPAGDIGVKLTDTAILHVGVAAEGGYDTNVFYNDVNQQNSAVFRVIPSFLITNNGRDGIPRSAVVYTLGANLTYREYLNNDPNVRNQRAFIPTAVGTLALVGEKARLSLGDSFSRTEEPPYFPTQPTIKRDNNQGTITVAASPGGGRLTTSLRYTNVFDNFESNYAYASTMTHDGLLDASWKWLPKTAIFIQGAGTFVHFLNPNAAGGVPNQARVDSTQVRGLAGLRGLLTPKTTVNLSLGYQTAFYQAPPPGSMTPVSNPKGLSNFTALLDLGFIPTLLTRMDLTLQHTFRNSPVLGNFYDVDMATLNLSHSLGRLVLGANSSAEYRRYQNYVNAMGALVPRKDTLFSGGLTVDYYIQRWFYGGVSYLVTLARSDKAVDPTAVNYTKQQIFARLGVAY
jgi:hypothetical protein